MNGSKDQDADDIVRGMISGSNVTPSIAFEPRTSKGVTMGKGTNAITAAIILNSTYAMANRLAVVLAPIAAHAEPVAPANLSMQAA